MKDLDKALRDKYEDEGYIFLTEFEYKNRRIDGIAIVPWSARNYAINLFEFKQNRGDWLKELKDPAKQEPFYEIGGRYWFVEIINSKGQEVIKVDEVPNGFGLMRWEDNRLKILKEAEYREPHYTIEFLMLFLNKVRKYYNTEAISDAYSKGCANTEKKYEQTTKVLEERVRELIKEQDDFCEATGISRWRYDGVKEMADAYNAFKRASEYNFSYLLDKINSGIAELEEHRKALEKFIRDKKKSEGST